MIINKPRELLTDEEIKKEEAVIKDALHDHQKENRKDASEALLQMFAKIGEVTDIPNKKYAKRIGHNKELLLEDLKEIVSALTKKDHQNYRAKQKEIVTSLAITGEDMKKAGRQGVTPSDYLKISTTDTPEGARFFIREALGYPYILYQDLFKDNDAEEIIETKILEWYPESFPTFQNPAVNTLSLLSERALKKDHIANTGTFTRNNVEITLEDIQHTKLSSTTNNNKVLMFFLIGLTENIKQYSTETEVLDPAKRTIQISVKDYMELCDLKDPKNARQQLTTAIATLYNASLTFKQKIYKKGEKEKTEEKAFDVHILSGKTKEGNIIRNGKAELIANSDFALALSHSSLMEYPKALFRIREKKNPYAYNIGYKIVTHYRMNKGKQNENRISIKTLLSVCTGLPTYEEERQSGSHITDHIIEPFERDLLSLKEDYKLLKDWHYCNPKGKQLTDKQIENYSYKEWINWLIEFTLL